LLLRQAAACRLPFGVGRKREAKSLYNFSENRGNIDIEKIVLLFQA